MGKTLRLLWLMALTMMLGLSACVDKDNPAGGENVENVETPDETQPTEDQLAVKVTEDLPTAVLGDFGEGSTGAALVKRLPAVTDHIGPETRLVLVPGSMFDGNGMSADDIDALVRLSLEGGYLAIERPTAQQLFNFGVLYAAKLIELQQLQYEETFDLSSEMAAAAAARSQAVERFQVRQANIQQMATTRAAGDNLNDVVAEMIIYGPTDYFMQQPFMDEMTAYVHTEDGDGNTTAAQAVTTKQERTAYVSGTLADAAAKWLNASEAKHQESAPRRAMHRAGGSAINDIMDASEEFTYNEAIDWRNAKNETWHYTDRVNMIVRTWGVHNMESNKDYYYLKQNVTLKMGNEKGWMIFHPTTDEDSWFGASNYGDYDQWYGSFLSQYITSINLTGSGSIRLEASKPDTDNNTSSTSVSVGSSSSSTYTCGISYGASGGFSGLNPTMSVNVSASHSVGTTSGTSFSMSMSQTSKDLHGVKNTSGNQVTWTYKGTLPQFSQPHKNGKIFYNHQTAADILTNDCDIANEICWSVANPSGQYTFSITSQPQTAALLFSYKSGSKGNRPSKYEYTTTQTSNHSQQLIQPNRAMQTWRMSITVDEWEGAEVAGAREYLQNEVRKQFPDIYADVFQVADKSASSLDAISAVINYSKKVFGNTANMEALKSLAKSKGVRKFSIHWRNDNGVQAKDPFVVEKPKPGEPIAQVVFCRESGTLYFVKTTPLSQGEKWDGHTIYRVWSGNDVTDAGGYPKWKTVRIVIGYQSTTVSDLATRVVIDKSFAEVQPKSMAEWFNGINVETIEGIENLNTSEVTDMSYMFWACSNLKTLNLDGFDMSKVTNVQGVFGRCTSLTTIYSSQGWDISSSANLFFGCDNLKGAVDFDAGKTNGSMANPYTGYFTMPEHSNEVNVYIKDAQANTDLLKQYVDQWVNIRYSRSLQAKMGPDGNYTPTPYTVCLPYNLDLSAAISSKQCAVYTLAAVTGGEFVFKKVSKTTLAAGTPYVVMVNSGKVSLSAKGVKIVTAEPGSSKVYTSVADWQKGSGKSIGNWMGTFDQWDSDEAVAWDAFGLKPSNNMWDYFSATGTGSIPAFRAFLSSSSIEQKEYKARYED